ncbi:receptor expression-enhancing protein 3-like [Sparus aurata]|uniref:receptor expression-enhancing protein 3-like n=1 Tax=Sparus aurata TaxID=8175 RepID=UPI0011C115F7|nr:receptor expression-enhancing protein 3 [Sparus aurata]
MVSWIISRSVVLVFGTLYPAYYSYKAVKTKNVKEYVRWMMYWIVFALYTVVETITDLTLAWFPLYYELKVAIVIWLLSPYTRGASLIYRKCLHPLLSSREKEIDEYIVQAKERSYETMVNFGKQGLSIAATAAVSAAVKASVSGLYKKPTFCSVFFYFISFVSFISYLYLCPVPSSYIFGFRKEDKYFQRDFSIHLCKTA